MLSQNSPESTVEKHKHYVNMVDSQSKFKQTTLQILETVTAQNNELDNISVLQDSNKEPTLDQCYQDVHHQTKLW